MLNAKVVVELHLLLLPLLLLLLLQPQLQPQLQPLFQMDHLLLGLQIFSFGEPTTASSVRLPLPPLLMGPSMTPMRMSQKVHLIMKGIHFMRPLLQHLQLDNMMKSGTVDSIRAGAVRWVPPITLMPNLLMMMMMRLSLLGCLNLTPK